MDLKNLKGIIFDVHRTLVDDSGFPHDRICRLLKLSGVNLDITDYYHLYDNLTKKYFNWEEIDPFICIREIHRRRLSEIYHHYSVTRNIEADLNLLWTCKGDSKIYPETRKVLTAVSGRFKMALLSNADFDDPLVEKLLSNGYKFDAVVTSQELKKYKPDPDLFYAVLRKLQLNKEEVVMVGDSPGSDILGARNAGVKIIWINRKKNALEYQYPAPDYEISDLTGLLDLL